MATDMIVPAGFAWDDPGSYAAILDHGRSGLAWELLRRKPAYTEAVAKMPARRGSAADAAFTTRWGLHFR